MPAPQQLNKNSRFPDLDFFTDTQTTQSLTCTRLAFFAGYFLSAGPAVFITRRINLPALTSIVEGLYFPLVLIVKLDIPLVSPLIQAWVRLFR